MKILMSLFDYTGQWSKPYADDPEWDVYRYDLQLGNDIFEVMADVLAVKANDPEMYVDGILAAPPCTDFAGSGASHWKTKETKPASYSNHKTALEFKNTVEHSVMMVYATLEIIEQFKPSMFWALENPVGRIDKMVPELKKYRMLSFQPYEYGDAYKKRTIIYGQFNPWLIKNPVKPIEARPGNHSIDEYYRITTRKQRQQQRSVTPPGFAQAFYQANN